MLRVSSLRGRTNSARELNIKFNWSKILYCSNFSSGRDSNSGRDSDQPVRGIAGMQGPGCG